MSGTLAERLREARERAGLSARALDEKAEITQGHTALIESGRRESPAVETVRKLAAALNVSLDWLVTGSERESEPKLPDPDESGSNDKIPDERGSGPSLSSTSSRPHGSTGTEG